MRCRKERKKAEEPGYEEKNACAASGAGADGWHAPDAVEPAAVGEELDTENPAEGDNEEMPEEPEETGAEEEAKAEAEAAPLAADASGTVAYLLGMRLENGYYTANKAEVGHYTEKPDSLKNYLFYEDGVLTVFGGIVAGNSGTEDWNAVLSVESGSLIMRISILIWQRATHWDRSQSRAQMPARYGAI